MADDTTRLIQATYAGDAEAKAQLARRVHERLQRVIRQVRAKYPGVRRQDETDDMLGDVWLKAVEAKVGLRTFPDYSAFQAYVAATTTNILKDRLKHLRHVVAHEEAVIQAGAPTAVEPLGATLDLLEALDALTEEERRIYQLRFVLDLPTQEVAAALHLSEPTIRRRFREIDVKLRAHLGLSGKDAP